MRSNYNHIKMKKLVYLLAAGSMAFVACQNSPSYKVTGSVEDITDGDTIYLQEYAGGNLVKLDSAIVKSGTFVFTGKQDTAVNRYITYMKGDKRYFTDLFLENGNINVTLGKESKVSGTPNNDAYQKFKVSENRKETRLWEGFIKSTRRVPSAMRNIIGGISS